MFNNLADRYLIIILCQVSKSDFFELMIFSLIKSFLNRLILDSCNSIFWGDILNECSTYKV